MNQDNDRSLQACRWGCDRTEVPFTACDTVALPVVLQCFSWAARCFSAACSLQWMGNSFMPDRHNSFPCQCPLWLLIDALCEIALIKWIQIYTQMYVVCTQALRNCHFLKDLKILPMQMAKQYGWHLETTVVDGCGETCMQEHQRLLAQHKWQKIFLATDAILSQAGGNQKKPSHTSEEHFSHLDVLRFVRNVP